MEDLSTEPSDSLICLSLLGEKLQVDVVKLNASIFGDQVEFDSFANGVQTELQVFVKFQVYAIGALAGLLLCQNLVRLAYSESLARCELPSFTDHIVSLFHTVD